MCARRGVGIQIQCANIYEVFSNIRHSLGATWMFLRCVSKASLEMGGGESFRRIPSWCSGQRLAHVSAAGVSAAPTEAAWTSTMTSFVCWVLAQKDLGKGVLVISSSCFLDNLKTFSFKYRVGTCSHQLRLP